MSKTGAKLLLLSVFAARGISFLFSKTLMLSMDPLNVLAVRFLTAFVLLAVIFFKKLLRCSRKSLQGGLILGVLYTVCMLFEMYGLRHIDSGVSALIENMAIVLVPIYLAVYRRTLPDQKTMICAVLAVTGVGFLSLTQFGQESALLGVLLAICAALTFALCIIATANVTQDADPITEGVIQIGVMGALSAILALLTGSFALPQSGQQWLMLLLLAVICSCFGFVFQPVGQKYLPADTAAVFTVINPLTASLMGILAAHEAFTPLKLIGYLLILGTLVFYNLPTGRKNGQ